MGVVKYTGPMASFHCPTNAEIRSLKVHFSPKQECSGDPSPENVRSIMGWTECRVETSGKNMAHILGYSAYTVNTPTAYRSLTNSYGTTISTINYTGPDTPLVITQVANTDYGTTDYRNGYFGIGIDNIIFNQYYDISFKVSNITNNPLGINYLTVLNPAGGTYLPTIQDGYCKIKNFQFKRSSSVPERCSVEIRVGGMSFTFSEFMITPANTNDQIYEPYHGETTNYEFGVLGKNKLNINDYTQLESVSLNNNYLTNINVDTRDNFQLYVAGYNNSTLLGQLSVQVNMPIGIYSKTFTLSNTYENMNLIYIKHNGSTRDIGIKIPVDLVVGQTYTISMDVTGNDPTTVGGLSFGNIQLELGSTATTYVPYNPKHTVYGGWVDLITGEVCEEWEYGDMGDLAWNTASSAASSYVRNVSYKNAYGANDIPPLLTDSSLVVTIQHFNQLIGSSGYYATINSLGRFYFMSPDIDGMSQTQIKEWMQGKKYCVYNTPTYYSLAPTQLQTFLGQNNVWSNADYVEVEYDLHETQDILARKQFIIANQPHIIKPTAAPLQNFRTDVPAPLKECKIYFSPVQEGTGDPSPENIRTIDGWTNLNVIQTDKNLFGGLPMLNLLSEKGATVDTTNHIASFSGPVANTINVLFDKFDTGQYTVIAKFTNLNGSAVNANMIFAYTDGSYKLFSASFAESVQGNIYKFLSDPNKTIKSLSCRWISGTANIYCDDFGVFKGDVDIKDFVPYSGTTLSIDWTTEAGTVYGGYVDLVKGEIVAEWTSIHAKDYTWYNYSSNQIFYTMMTDRTADSRDISNKLISYTGYNWNNAPDNSIISGNNTSMFIKHLGVTNTTEFKEWLDEIDPIIYYKLATPIVYSITPQTFKTLRGTNNIWASNNGENIELAYWSH